ncbi:hypothetical protein CSUI_003254, partial [Cystoisospora suis]
KNLILLKLLLTGQRIRGEEDDGKGRREERRRIKEKERKKKKTFFSFQEFIFSLFFLSVSFFLFLSPFVGVSFIPVSSCVLPPLFPFLSLSFFLSFFHSLLSRLVN